MLFYIIVLLFALAFAALCFFYPREKNGTGAGGFNPIFNFFRGRTENAAAANNDKKMGNNRNDRQMKNDSVIVLLNNADPKVNEVSAHVLPPEGDVCLTIGRDPGLSDMIGSNWCGSWHIKLTNNRGTITAEVREENTNGTLTDEYKDGRWVRSSDRTGEQFELKLRADHIPTYLLLAVDKRVKTGEVMPESISRDEKGCDLVTLIRI